MANDKIVSADEAREMLRRDEGRHTHNRDGDECEMCEAEATRKDALAFRADALARTVVALHASESAAVARASHLALDLHAAQSEGAEARRDVRLRDETIEELRRTVRETSRACETLRERCERTEALHAEVERLREIVEGRTTPPTKSEMDAIRASGGAVRFQVVRASGGTLRGHVYDHDEVLQFQQFDGVRWWAHDATGRPCAWPVVGGAR